MSSKSSNFYNNLTRYRSGTFINKAATQVRKEIFSKPPEFKNGYTIELKCAVYLDGLRKQAKALSKYKQQKKDLPSSNIECLKQIEDFFLEYAPTSEETEEYAFIFVMAQKLIGGEVLSLDDRRYIEVMRKDAWKDVKNKKEEKDDKFQGKSKIKQVKS